jgi:phosphoglycerate dehydrogenase-like enzyme
MAPRILVLTPPALYQRLFTPATDAALRALGDVNFHTRATDLTAAELAAVIGDYDAVMTGWGSPTFTEPVLTAAVRLQLIAHSAGSIKKLLPPPVFERDIAVTHAAAAMGRSVAEMSLTLILMLLRRVPDFDRSLKAGEPWSQTRQVGWGQDLRGLPVGVVGAGHVGREVIALLQAVGADVAVYDPYLSAETAQTLGVRPARLDDLLRTCPVVTLHAPPTDETRHMIGARELCLLADDAIFINTARSWLVDEAALLAELQSGRIRAALDVFDQEPLPPDHPFRSLDNVVLLPHIAAKTIQADQRISQIIVDEIGRFFNGEPLLYRVTGDRLATMA